VLTGQALIESRLGTIYCLLIIDSAVCRRFSGQRRAELYKGKIYDQAVQILPLDHITRGRILLRAVSFYVLLSGILCVFGCVSMVAVREVRVMGCFLMMTGFVMLGSFVVVVRSMLMMFGRLLVMMGCFL
jgi:hypothetical protein